MADRDITLFSTAPQSKHVPGRGYVRALSDVARWSEEAGCEGMLVYTDNGLADPWLVAQLALQATERLAPLVAVQPVYMHPYTAAKMVATLGQLHDRRLYLNFVAGGFRRDLAALDDHTEHDARYDRIVEYATIVERLLAGETITFDGASYTVTNLRMTPAVPVELQPGLVISGSSPAGLAAARAIGATPVKYPKRPEEEVPYEAGAAGIRVGVIARQTADEAWRVAHARFPADRKGQLTHMLAMKISDSQWHRQLSDLGVDAGEDDPYWLWPFENYATFCPYLVGSYARVAAELERYMDRGFSMFILDIPPDDEELHHTRAAFALATDGVPS